MKSRHGFIGFASGAGPKRPGGHTKRVLFLSPVIDWRFCHVGKESRRTDSAIAGSVPVERLLVPDCADWSLKVEEVGSDFPGASCLIYLAAVFLSAKHLSERSGTATFLDFQSCCVANSPWVILNLEWEQECTCPYPSDLTGSCWSSKRAAWGRALAGLDRGRLDLRSPSHTTTFNDPCLKLHLSTKNHRVRHQEKATIPIENLLAHLGFNCTVFVAIGKMVMIIMKVVQQLLWLFAF